MLVAPCPNRTNNYFSDSRFTVLVSKCVIRASRSTECLNSIRMRDRQEKINRLHFHLRCKANRFPEYLNACQWFFFTNAFPFFFSTFFSSFLSFLSLPQSEKKKYSHGSLLFQICAQRQECVLSHIECRRGAAEKCKKLLHNVLRVHTLALSLSLSLCVYIFYRTTAAGRARCSRVFRFKLTHSHVQSHRIGDK